MAIFAEMVLHPGGIVAWILVGLIAGWLAAKMVGGGGFGVVADIVIGLIGALVGGFVFGLLMGSGSGEWGNPGFWGSVGVAFLGACILLVGVRFMGLGRRV
jgi:uncharacterized membrane protein YeaQ/YmgE (transglycosylase-associated protein family)